MPQLSTNKWLVRTGIGIVVVVAIVGFWAGTNVDYVKTRYAAYKLRSATSDEERMRAAESLLNLGTSGQAKLIAFLPNGDDACRTAAASTLDRCLAAMADGDQRAISIAGQIFDVLPQSDDAARKAILGVLPNILKRTGSTFAGKCREAIAAGLKMSDSESRIAAIRLALHPVANMRRDLLPLLADADPRVRGAALFGAASVTDGAALISDEDLFRWLHDPDEGVRKVCYDALVGRDRSEVEIGLGLRLANPDASERLKLLLDLRYDDEVADPEPWLERLSRDHEPAIRAGAARVILEVTADRKQSCPVWVARVTDSDPDPTVRRIAAFFRKELLRTVGDVRSASYP